MRGKYYVSSGFIIKQTRYAWCIYSMNLNKIVMADAFPSKK